MDRLIIPRVLLLALVSGTHAQVGPGAGGPPGGIIGPPTGTVPIAPGGPFPATVPSNGAFPSGPSSPSNGAIPPSAGLFSPGAAVAAGPSRPFGPPGSIVGAGPPGGNIGPPPRPPSVFSTFPSLPSVSVPTGGNGAGSTYSGGGPANPSYGTGGSSYPSSAPSYTNGGSSYSGSGPSYSGSGPSYNSGGSNAGPSYSPGAPSYSGGAPSYSGAGPSYSGGGSTYTGNGPSYSGGGARGGTYSAGGTGGGAYSGGGTGSYGGGNYGAVGYSGGGGGCCGGGGGGNYNYGGLGVVGGCAGCTGGCAGCGGGCGDISDPCYSRISNCIIVNAQPYERRAQITLDTCKTLCRNSTSGQFQCRSFVYDNINQICDLFAHTGNQSPAKEVKYPGRDYYESTGIANCITAPTPSAPCGSGQKAVYVQVPGYQSSASGSGTQSAASSVQTCIDACDKGQTSDGKPITCKSLDFVNGQCTFFPSSVQPGAQGAGLQPNSGSVHVDQVCLDSGLNCAGPVDREPQHILVGYAEVVVDATDFNDCVKKCIQGQTSGVDCKSGIFYYGETTNNCILNTETKEGHPDLYIMESQDTVDYFEPNCAGGPITATVTGNANTTSGVSSRRLALIRGILNKKNHVTNTDDSNTVRKDDLEDDQQDGTVSGTIVGEWTNWSSCEKSKTGRRIRFRACSKPILKQCPFETEWCKQR